MALFDMLKVDIDAATDQQETYVLCYCKDLGREYIRTWKSSSLHFHTELGMIEGRLDGVSNFYSILDGENLSVHHVEGSLADYLKDKASHS